jgi:hypothetical protein
VRVDWRLQDRGWVGPVLTADLGGEYRAVEEIVMILSGLVALRGAATESVWLTAYALKQRVVEGTRCRAVASVRDAWPRVGHSEQKVPLKMVSKAQ